MITKLEGWQSRLHAELERVRKTPFAWGEHDCALFVTRTIDCMCGTRLEKQLHRDLAAWHDAAGAARVIHDSGTLTALVSRYLGETSPPLLCREGDPMEFELDGRRYLGVHEGHAIVSTGEKGRAIVELRHARHGWRLG